MLFTTTPVSLTGKWSELESAYPLRFTPQINETALVTDSLEWHKISGRFVADQPYQYLTLGNFYDDDQTTIFETKVPLTRATNGAYYFIDDVYVADAGLDLTVTVPRLGPDTTLCPGQTLPIALPNDPLVHYYWQDGSTASSYRISRSGTYWVTATTGPFQLVDTVRVTVLPPVSLPADTALCRGETLSLSVSHPLKHYRWSDGSSDSTLSVSQSGTYRVEVPGSRCAIGDTIQIEVLDCPGPVPNVITPNGDGKNDAFVVENGQLTPWELKVYNRWGRKVYQSAAYQNDWQGSDLPAGLYYYQLWSPRLKRKINGWIQVLR